MKWLDLPVIGARPLDEFVYGGEHRPAPAPDADAAAVAAHVFHRSGGARRLREWWYHEPTGRWYVVDRDTHEDRVERVVPLEEVAVGLPDA